MTSAIAILALFGLLGPPRCVHADESTVAAATPTPAVSPTAGTHPMPVGNAGPEHWDAAGRVKCSVGSETFARTCGFRLVRNRSDKSVDLWVRNLVRGKATYRFFRYAGETFTTNDGAKAAWQRRGNKWSVNIDGIEFYLVPDTLLQGD